MIDFVTTTEPVAIKLRYLGPFSRLTDNVIPPGRISISYLQRILVTGGSIAPEGLAHLKELGVTFA